MRPQAVCWMKVFRALMIMGPLHTAALSSCKNLLGSAEPC